MPARRVSRRSHTESLLAYDLSISSWLIEGGTSPDGFDVLLDVMPLRANGGERTSLALAGFDESGRGALAGPLVVACVHLEFDSADEVAAASRLIEGLSGVDDSKRVPAARRELLYDAIDTHACFGVGASSAAEIDRVGIVPACRIAARRAYRNLGVDIEFGLFDRGLTLRGHGETAAERAPYPLEGSAIGADGRSLHVACASIIAKVWRDRAMVRLAEAFPGYALERHKGYGTTAHRAALKVLGPTPVHRRSFLRGSDRTKSQFC